MTIAKKSKSSKALQTAIAKGKKTSRRTLIEWEIAFNTNPARSKLYGQVVSQEMIKAWYEREDRYDYCEHERGASKTCFLDNPEGNPFKYIVVKRHLINGYIPDASDEHAKCTGNQLIDEINCWEEFAETDKADFLCPILKYFKSKSDKVSATSEKMQDNVIIIAQKAVYVSNCYACCEKAEHMNKVNGFMAQYADDRYNDMKAFSKEQGWRDALGNGGNCGVIFDYASNCYKAVFIDYAL